MGQIRLLALVGVGGAIGALVRWQIAEAWTSGSFPWSTFVVNIAGCAVLGVVSARGLPTALNRLLGTGFAGGLTTFSTLTVEVVELLDSGSATTALVYVLVSLVTGLLAFVAGRNINPTTEVAP